MARETVTTERVLHALLPDILELTPDELDELTGVDAATLVCRYYDSLAARAALRHVRTLPAAAENPRIDGNVIAMPPSVGVVQMAELVASEIFVHFRNRTDGSWNDFSWDGTHLAAVAMRQAENAGVSRAERAYLLNAIFDAFAAAASGYVGGADARFDDLWPILEAFEELAAEVWHDQKLSDIYASRYAALATIVSSPVLTCLLAWGVNELLERGKKSMALASKVAERLLAADESDQVRCVLGMLVRLRPACRRYLPEDAMLETSRAADDLLRSLVAQVTSASRAVGAALLVAKTDRHSFAEIVPADLTQLIAVARDGTALAGVLAMAGIKLALRSLYQPLASTTGRARLSIVDYFCKLILLQIGEGRHGTAFLATESLEGLRDHFPNECARSMASVLSSASQALRQAAAVCIAEGYEERYGGKQQRAVPRFDARHGEVRFIVP